MRARAGEGRARTRWPFYVLMALLPIVVLLLAIWLLQLAGLLDLKGILRQAAVQYFATAASDEQRQHYLELVAADLSGIWTAVPEPEVGKLLLPGHVATYKGAEVVINRAGFRSATPYLPKGPWRARIVCLGDSFVMGVGGAEEDRFGDQLERLLEERDVRLGGRKIQVYSLGVGSWTALNEARYMTSRVSAYRPEIVLALMVPNDIGDSNGVLGRGLMASNFSPEVRHLGSGRLAWSWPRFFGFASRNHLAAGLGPESISRWRRTFAAWRRLEEVLEAAGGKLVLSVFAQNEPLFAELVKHYRRSSGLRAPLLEVDTLGHQLPHDPHPDREGHRLLALQYLHALAELDYLPLDAALLPPLPPALRRPLDPEPRAKRLAELQREVAESLPQSIRFDALDEKAARALLGGIYPASLRQGASGPPFGSPKSAFLLRRRSGAESVSVDIELPDFPELFPFELDMYLNGEPAGRLELADVSQAGRRRLTGRIAGEEAVLEVVLRTDAYWSDVLEPTMKSYRLLAVSQD